MKYIIFTIFILISIFTYSNCELPVIDVYIESLCPDCMNFIGGSFKNFHLYEDKDSLAVVNFIPFGNANEKWNGEKWEFTCQHGENECLGNTLENCALNRLDRNGGHDFLICVEDNIRGFGKDFNQTLTHCVGEDSKLELYNCAFSEEGNQLQHQAAQKTPQHNYVPWVHFNGKHDVEIENRILTNMLDFLCEIQGRDCSDQKFKFTTQEIGSKCLNENSDFLKFLN